MDSRQEVRHMTLTHVYAGSIPAYPAIYNAPVVELADTLDLGSNSKECRFDSCQVYHLD